MDTRAFGEAMKARGFDFYTGVPCSFLKDLINYAINDCDYVGAANEGDAVAIASGAQIGGRKSVVLMQNSGLTNAVSPLTSLNYCFKLPVLGFVSLRGEAGLADEPQHELMGQITTQMLELMQVEWAYLSDEIEQAREQLEQADRIIASDRPFFFVVKKGTFSKEVLKSGDAASRANYADIRRHPAEELPLLSRYEALSILNRVKDAQTLQLATTGFTGRELYEVEDSKQNLYMVGSMGCISSLGLGLALSQTSRKVVAIDGDGALLMRMGNMATTGRYGPSNLLHILLDNHAHDSTGGQETVSAGVDFAAIAAACGYEHVEEVRSAEQFEQAVRKWQQYPKLTFIRMPISTGTKEDLSRPKVKPHEVKERLMAFLHG
ncbi:phosphonopyruvate decarboxylase [Saccharibacillus sp. O23]|nr:phosphonopyruvate decarboxylase [Saccharibacillus sp. O23]